MSELKIVIEGTAQEGSLELKHFSSLLESFHKVLTGLDTDLHKHKEAGFLVSNMSRNSPYALSFTQTGGRADTVNIFQVLIDELSNLQQGLALKVISERTLETLKAFTGTAIKRMREISLNIGNKEVTIDEETDNQIANLLVPKEYCLTEIEGVLEQINIHDHANIFFIYPDVGPKRVKCHFDNQLRYDSMGGLGQKVAVRGEAGHRLEYPNEIWVSGIEIFPPDDELPTFEDIRGMFKKAFAIDSNLAKICKSSRLSFRDKTRTKQLKSLTNSSTGKILAALAFSR